MKIHRVYLLIFIVGVTLTKPVLAQGNLYHYQDAKTWEFGPRVGFTTSMINSKGDPNLEKGIKLG